MRKYKSRSRWSSILESSTERRQALESLCWFRSMSKPLKVSWGSSRAKLWIWAWVTCHTTSRSKLRLPLNFSKSTAPVPRQQSKSRQISNQSWVQEIKWTQVGTIRNRTWIREDLATRVAPQRTDRIMMTEAPPTTPIATHTGAQPFQAVRRWKSRTWLQMPCKGQVLQVRGHETKCCHKASSKTIDILREATAKTSTLSLRNDQRLLTTSRKMANWSSMRSWKIQASSIQVALGLSSSTRIEQESSDLQMLKTSLCEVKHSLKMWSLTYQQTCQLNSRKQLHSNTEWRLRRQGAKSRLETQRCSSGSITLKDTAILTS